MSETRVESEDVGAVRVLTLSRPEKKNAFDVAMASALWSAIEAADADPAVRVDRGDRRGRLLQRPAPT